MFRQRNVATWGPLYPKSSGDQVTEYTSGRSKDDLVQFMIRSLYGDEAETMAPAKFSQQQEERGFLESRSIRTLSRQNFTQVLSNKDTATLVMFYDPDCIYCQSAKPHFLKAAKTTMIKNRVYAAVDCTKEEQLCEQENIKTFPTFKLFVGGKFLTKYNQSPNFVNMRTFLENAPLETNLDDHPKAEPRMPEIKYVPGGQKKFKEEL